MREVNLWDPEERKLLEAMSPLAWIPLPDGSYRLQVRDVGAIRVHQDLLGAFHVTLEGTGTVAHHGTFQTLSEAISSADNVFRQRFPAQLRLVDRSASWRGNPPSERQVKYLRKIGRYRDGIDAGEASLILATHFARNPRKQGVGKKWHRRAG
jgi:hypothetical protein